MSGWWAGVAWWLWALVVWCLLSVPAAVLLGRGIALRERERPAQARGSRAPLPTPRAEDDAATG